MSRARALDADTKGALRDIHRRVGATILFESSGGQVQKVAHLPELRFALGEPDVDTTSIDNAAAALEAKGFFIRSVGTDGYQISHKATLKKVVNDRRAALDDDAEVRPRLRQLVLEEFRRGSTIPVEPFPESGDAISDAPRLRLIVMPPEVEWSEQARPRVTEWLRLRGAQNRQHPGALLFCLKRPGRGLKDKVETWLAWERVAADVRSGTLGEDYDRNEVAEVQGKVSEALDDARDEVWATYTIVAVADTREPNDLKAIDLGAGHASSGETLSARILMALKAEGLLSESVGAAYIERHWPPALQEAAAWPLASLRQAFLDGSLTRLLDPESVLRAKIPEFVAKGDMGLASGQRPGGTYQRVWYSEPVPPDEVVFDHDVYLLKKERAKALIGASVPAGTSVAPSATSPGVGEEVAGPPPASALPEAVRRIALRISGALPVEVWNRLGTRLIPKLRALKGLQVRAEFAGEIDPATQAALIAEVKTTIEELGLSGTLRVDQIQVSDQPTNPSSS